MRFLVFAHERFLIWSVTLLVCLPALYSPAFAKGLAKVEADGYLQWLHSVEQIAESRQKADQPDDHLLYPFDSEGFSDQETTPFKHLAISKALMDFEHRRRVGIIERETSPLNALTMARNYLNLCEYDSALVWFQRTARLDTVSHFATEVGPQHLSTAAALSDSLAVVLHLMEMIEDPQLYTRDRELVVAFRFLVSHDDNYSLALLTQKISVRSANISPRVRYWLAYTYSYQKRWDMSLNELKTLITAGGLSLDLSQQQRTWVLKAIPNLFYLSGQPKSGRELYDILARSKFVELRDWADFQRANQDFLSHKYLRALSIFERLCDSGAVGLWRDNACEMASLARELNRIRKEGEPYGTASFYKR